MATITTTDGKTFTEQDSADMARLIFRRFGGDLSAATAAWRRMLQNSCDERGFQRLLDYYECDPTDRYAVMVSDGSIVSTGATIREAVARAGIVAYSQGRVVSRMDPTHPWKKI